MILRHTQSLCPVCLRRLDAVYECTGTVVLLRKECPDHGTFSVPVWQNTLVDFSAWVRDKIPSYPEHPVTEAQNGCPFDCGLCPEHGQHTCTGLLEVTKRCTLHCPVCYAQAGANSEQKDPDSTDLARRLTVLRKLSGPCNVQISGGEPTVREDLPEIVRLAATFGFGLLQLNTNGLRLAAEEGYAQTLREAGLDSVYLQWDGVSETAFETLRGRPLLREKMQALEDCARAGLGVVLVATVVKGVNDSGLGDLLRFAVRAGPCVRGLHIQPAAFFGRYPWPLACAPRMTLPEVIEALVRQAPELISLSDVHPPCCEHALCSFSAVYTRNGAGGLTVLPQKGGCCTEEQIVAAEGAAVSRRFTAMHWKGVAREHLFDPNAAQSSTAAFDRFLARAGIAQRFTLSAMAFQDALSVDIARVRGCCIHVIRDDGRLLPFCLHNMTAMETDDRGAAESAECGLRLYPET
ncbi:MAG: radical SAM protein [Desulfovibrionaceae bacterium]|nr:radical SAM protein [Desulfovibrionaceae bacterium]